jgi:hypothetical protein
MIGLSPIEGQMISEGLAGVDRAFGISEAVSQTVARPMDTTIQQNVQQNDTPAIIGDRVIGSGDMMAGSLVRVKNTPAITNPRLGAFTNQREKVVGGVAVINELIAEYVTMNPTANIEDTAIYVYRAMNRRPDGTLGRFTRVDQRRIKRMVQEVGIEETAAKMRMDVDVVLVLIEKRFRQPPLTISRSFFTKLKKFNRDVGDVNAALKQVANLAKACQGTPARRRGRSTGKMAAVGRTTTVVN